MTPSILSDEYRLLKEHHVSGHSGSSTGDILLLLSVAPAGLFLNGILVSRFRALQPPTELPRFLCEFMTIVVPCLLAYTTFASHAWMLLVAQLTVACIACLRPCTTPPPVPPPPTPRLAFITHFRGALMLATWICILAVDFYVFPRRLAKTEAVGVSLMDMGVGMIVFSSGFVAASRSRGSFARDALPSVPLLLLAGIKIVANAAVNYQVHESEYGTHWNFFATLSFLAVLHAGINAALRYSRSHHAAAVMLGSGVGLAWAYQAALQAQWDRWGHPTLQQFILTGTRAVSTGDPCHDLVCHACSLGRYMLVHNREGVFGCCGFAALYLVARGVGAILQSFQTHSSSAYTFIMCMFALFSTWSLHAVVTASYGDPSRRLVNAPYVSWITAMAGTLLVLMWMADAAVRELSSRLWEGHAPLLQSSLLVAINSANLAAFMLANLGTGIVNFTMHTLFVDDATAVGVLAAYLACVSGVVFVAHRRNIKLKVW